MLGLEVYDRSDVFQARASRILRATCDWPLSAAGTFAVDVAMSDEAIPYLTLGRRVKLVADEGVINRGTVRDVESVRVVDNQPALSLTVVNQLDDLNQKDVMRRWWHDPTAASTILGTGGGGGGAPPGMLYNTGWTLSIEVGVGARLRELEFIWGSLLRSVIEAIDAAGAAWWADPITETLYVGEFGSDNGVTIARPDGPDPEGRSDANVLQAGRIVKRVGRIEGNRVFAIGSDADDDRVILPAHGDEPVGHLYDVAEIAGWMPDQTERYIEDAASQAAYEVIERSLVNRDIGMQNGMTMEQAQRWLYWYAEAALRRWKDPPTYYDVQCLGHAISHIGRVTVTPGSQSRLFVQGYVEEQHPITGATRGVQYENVNDLFYVINVTREWNAQGVELGPRVQLASSLALAPVLPIPY